MNFSEKECRQLSKFLSLVLRHQPSAIGIELDDAGWTSVDDLITAMNGKGRNVSRKQLEFVVENNDKRRFAISDDGERIRASQGHSVGVELGYQPASPPAYLLHGTPATSLAAIRAEGLKRMKRHHVHMHVDESTAFAVGARRGTPVVLGIRSQEMLQDGCVFFVTENGVWLTEHVPSKYIDFPSEA